MRDFHNAETTMSLRLSGQHALDSQEDAGRLQRIKRVTIVKIAYRLRNAYFFLVFVYMRLVEEVSRGPEEGQVNCDIYC